MLIRNEALTPQHRAAGLQLVEIGDDFLEMQNQNGHRITIFTQHATIRHIRQAADYWMLENDCPELYEDLNN